MTSFLKPRYYNKDGEPIHDTLEWTRLLEDRNYSRVGLFQNKKIRISTVWLGLDYNFGGGPPLIFETMVFPEYNNKRGELEMQRYTTLEEAEIGHNKMVDKWTQTLFQKAIHGLFKTKKA